MDTIPLIYTNSTTTAPSCRARANEELAQPSRLPLGGKTPVDRIAEVSEITPLAEQVETGYDGLKERIRHREWRVDKILAEHHRRAGK